MTASTNLRRRAAALAVTALVGVVGPAQADDRDRPVPAACGLHPVHVANPGCVPALTSEAGLSGITLPNLSPDVRYVLVERSVTFDQATQTFWRGEPYLHFDGWVQNLGEVPLELTADDPENPTTAMQCVSWVGHVCQEKRVVGEYAWHEEHKHFHFTDFADYQLRRLGPDGRPDYSDAGLLRASEKLSFCLIDAALVDQLDPAPPYYLTCGPTLQGVSPKWADVYGPSTTGQNFPLAGLTDGRYALVVTMDYAGRLYETDDTDNVVEVIVELSEGVTEATIVAKSHP